MDVQEIADRIMAYMAQQNARPNHAFGVRQQLYNNLFSRANPREQDLIVPAINSLVEKRYVTIEDRHGESLVLTEQGYAQLYPLDDEAKEHLGKLIMNQFEKQHSRPNHILDYRNLRSTIIDKLNPAEKELWPEAIADLVAKGWIQEEDRNGPCLVLTEEGYDTLYR